VFDIEVTFPSNRNQLPSDINERKQKKQLSLKDFEVPARFEILLAVNLK